MRATEAKVKLKMKATKCSRDNALSNSAQIFPFEVPRSTPAQESAVSATKDVNVRRGNRERFQKKAPDMVYGSDPDYIHGSTVGTTKHTEVHGNGLPSPACKSDKYCSGSFHGLTITTARKPRTAGAELHGNKIHPDIPTRNDGSVSSDTIAASVSPKSEESAAVSNGVRADVCKILSVLRSSPGTHIELPDLRGDVASTEETPYSAETLATLYLTCYREEEWDFCDLVADTWIRALQRASNDDANHHIIWRENRALLRIQATGKKGFDQDAPDYDLDVEDPAMGAEVARFDENILSNLYENTFKESGARLLWADAMALCGSELEETTQQMVKHGHHWHPDLVFDIMCTSLRMVRRRLTLKIEEGTEGAWCMRYHEHEKHGQPCYRWSAWQERLAQDKEDGTKETSCARRRKRIFRGDEGEDESQSKRVRFDAGDVEAESESEEE